MKKVLRFGLIAVLLFAAMAGYGLNRIEAKEKPVTIKILQAQPEYTEAYNAYINAYKKVRPNVTIELQVLQADLPTVLKTRIAAGDTPDIFMTTIGELKEYDEYAADLSKEPLAKAMLDGVRETATYNGKLAGVPFVTDTFALIYNKELFAKAGIAKLPKTLSELEDVCKKLQAKGITPFANGYKEWWVQKHIFQHFINGETKDTRKLVNDFKAGKTKFKEHPTLLKYFDFLDLTVKYGMPKPLESDFNAEVGDFANGKAAMITGQGQWIEASVVKVNPDFQFGVMGYPVNDDPAKANICAGCACILMVNKDSKVLNEAKRLLNWRYTSQYGKNWFSDVAKVIGPVKGVKPPNMKLPKAFSELAKTLAPSGSPILYSSDAFHQKFGEIVQAYLAKGMTRDQACDEIEKAWVKIEAGK